MLRDHVIVGVKPRGSRIQSVGFKPLHYLLALWQHLKDKLKMVLFNIILALELVWNGRLGAIRPLNCLLTGPELSQLGTVSGALATALGINSRGHWSIRS